MRLKRINSKVANPGFGGWEIEYELSNDEENAKLEEEKKKTDFPEKGDLAKFFKNEIPKDKITFTMSAEDFLGLIKRESDMSLISSYDSITADDMLTIWPSYSTSTWGTKEQEFLETERISNNSLLALLMNKYRAESEISKDLEHKLIWLYPPFAEALGLDKISYAGKLLYLRRRPGGIRLFSKSTTEMQLISVGYSWELIRDIKRPHKEALNEAAKMAIPYYERKAEDLRRWRVGELSKYDTKDMERDYKFFSKYKFDPIIKQDILGTIMSIFLEHEMKPFI